MYFFISTLKTVNFLHTNKNFETIGMEVHCVLKLKKAVEIQKKFIKSLTESMDGSIEFNVYGLFYVIVDPECVAIPSPTYRPISPE